MLDESKGELLSFNIPKDQLDGFVNNRKEFFKFKFERIFAPDTQQEAIFDAVAKPVTDG